MNNTEVFINFLLFDLAEDVTIAASYGNIYFGQLGKRKGVKSNRFSGSFSNNNKLIWESAEVAGSYSLLPYRRAVIEVHVSGVAVFEGYCTLEESTDGYQVQSYAGATDFYDKISNKKITALDLSEWSHVWNDTNIKASWTNEDGYMYAFVEYGKGTPGSLIPPEFLLPQIFFHTLIKQIATDAGYTLQGEVLSNQRFLEQVVILNKFPLPIAYGGTWEDLASLLPDLTQSKYWLDFANMYGLQFDIDELTHEIRANYIDRVLFNEPEQWTHKVDKSEKRRTKYKFEGTGQTSYLRYKYDPPTELNGCIQDFQKAVAVDDTTLPLEEDVYKSENYMIQDEDPVSFPDGTAITRTFVVKPGKGFAGIWDAGFAYQASETIVWYAGTYYQPIASTTGDVPPSSPSMWKVIAEKDAWDIKNRPMYGRLTVNVGSFIEVDFVVPQIVTRIISNTGMSWEDIYPLHYRVFDRIIKRAKIVEELVKLNYADVNQLDFTKAKNINNELYFLQEVKQFKLNQVDSTLVELVRI